ncbi:MAG: glycosyltransferase family 39 protein, partial [Verrucomicrobia bacterium]|nr:glycosyltransferase family 39 protein [Verrucomicrobiota bacterium]
SLFPNLAVMSSTGAQRPAGDLRGLVLALLIALPLYLFGTFGHDLWRPAEAREAGIAREMIENGNWVATYLNGHLFLEKPPLYTWAIALPLKWLGYRDWVVRIPVFLFTLGTLCLTYMLARRQLGIAGAQGALVSLASMWLFMEVNHGAMIDNGLMFFIVLAMLAFYRLGDRDRWYFLWACLFYISLGLAFLCKGGIGPALILVVAAGFVLSHRQWSILRSWHPALGLGILGLIIGGWLWALWLKGGETYFRVFFIDNHLYRLLGKAGPTQAWFYYIPYILIVAFPWLFLVPAGLWVAWNQRREEGTGARRFWNYLFWWIAAMFVLLSVAGGKDNQYLLPLLPPLAVICGAWVERTLAGKPYPHWCLSLMWIFTVVVVPGVVVAPLVPVLNYQKINIGSLLWTLGLGVVGIGVCRALWFRRWQVVWAGMALLVVGTGFVLGLFIENVLNEHKTAKPLCVVIRDTLPPGATLWGYDLTENTEGLLIFYGLRPKRVTTLEEAAVLAQQTEPVIVLLSSRDPSHEFREQLIKTGRWQVVRQVCIGNRYYWLVGNAAAQPP